MRKLIALMLILSLLAGLTQAAFAADIYTLDIYWIANVNSDKPYKDLGAAVNDYLADETSDKTNLAQVTEDLAVQYLTPDDVKNSKIRKGVEDAINEYLAKVHKANRKVRKMQVRFHLIFWDPQWTEQAIAALMADEKIDLIFTADWEGYTQEIEADKLLELESALKEDGEGILETLSSDFLDGIKVHGHIYGIPTNKELCVPSGIIVNKTAADLIGWDLSEYADGTKKITTPELEPWLEKYKAMFPDKYPYLMEKDRWADEPWSHEWIGLEEDVLSMKFAKDENGKYDETVYSIYETDEQEEHIRLMYKWAQEGYISPDSATQDYNRIFGTGDFLVFTQPLKGKNYKSLEMIAANRKPGDPEFECVEIIMQDKYKVTCQAGGSMFAIPRTGRSDLAMQYLNLMHTDPTLVNLMLFGVEGVNYTKANESQVELADGANWYGMHGGAWTVGNTKLQYVLSTEDPEKNAELQKFALDAPMTASYGFRFDKKRAETLKAVEDVVREYARNLMVGAVDPDDPEKGLEAFRKALKDAGIDELKAEVEKQYEEWKIDTKK
ncbi:MAG: ABC transporter substrate-binding protein [Clostridia bacterium]|nr:ABC transporter substrate-binding protein [Clostridia bacterium]MBR6965576.1 ABC transporter substrate-binding protein [Clostridia bacterium]